MYNGIVNIYKEKGFTSHDVVAKLRGITKQKKIGHTGTLDPDAEGVLPVCFGSATKLCDIITDKTKEYKAVLLLGQSTDTQDVTGTVIEKSDSWSGLTNEDIKTVIDSFVGEYDQIPPMYSAIKVNGQKLYELARKGETIERKPRRVEITGIEITEINLPRVTFTVGCSKGTYIRTLCNDIGEKLGCFGCMESLLRTRVGIFDYKKGLKLSEVESLVKEDKFSEALIAPEDMFDYPEVCVREEFSRFVYNGNKLTDDQLERSPKMVAGFVKIYDHKNIFMGIYEKKGRVYHPFKMFL